MRAYRDMIGGSLHGSLHGSLLLGVSTLALLAGCDWFDGNTPVSSKQMRPGAERSVAASGLPSASAGRQYDSSVAPVDETRTGPQIGSIVAAKGGQKAQQEALAKEAAASDAKARVEADRVAADRKAADAAAAAASPPASSPPSSQPAQAAAPPAPVTTTAALPPVDTAAATPPAATPATPPAQIATPPVAETAPRPVAVASVPVRPADPNKAFEPPSGWVPPGQRAPVVTASTSAPTPAPLPAAAPAAPPAEIASAPPPAPPAVTPAAIAPPPAPTPVVVASAPARSANPNKAFEPPPGWVPPGQGGPAVDTAGAPPTQPPSQPVVTTASVAPPPTPAPSPPPAAMVRQGAGESSMPSSPSDRPGFAHPSEMAAAAAPSAPVAVAPTPEPVAPPAAPPMVTATPVSELSPGPAPVAVAPQPEPPPANVQADIARAQSGSVPFSAITTPPGGPLQVAVIQFGRASSGLGGRDSDILRRVARIQRKNGGTVRVVAHAEQDVTGSSSSAIERGNYDVSRRRALAIANQLVALGVPRSAIVAEAASDSEPLYATNTPRGIAANRRAEIFLDL